MREGARIMEERTMRLVSQYPNSDPMPDRMHYWRSRGWPKISATTACGRRTPPLPEEPQSLLYPAAADGSLPLAYRRSLDPLTTFAYLAAATSRVRIGTSTINPTFTIPCYAPVPAHDLEA